MEGSLYAAADTLKFSTSLSTSNANNPFIPCQTLVSPCSVRGLSLKVSISWPSHASCIVQQQKNNNGFVVGCEKWGSEREVEGDEMKPHEDEEKGSISRRRGGMSRFWHKCGERKGIVELLECLEKEAIMGEDVGKDPTDYNRRAQIFDRSSRVFQTLKELNDDVFPQDSS